MTAPADGSSAPAHARRRILLSCFACSPLWGSEPGVGWQWLLQLAQRHEVVLLTHAYFRSHLEPALAAAGLQHLQVQYFEAPAFGAHPHRQLNSWLYYTWWQWRVRKVVKAMLARQRFDLVHHLTWGTLRFPCFLGNLGVPLVMGPLGGGEAAPLRLFRGLPLKVFLFDVLRSLTLSWVKLDPLATWGPKRSALVLCKSADSLARLPASVQPRALVLGEIGSPPLDLSQREVPVSGPRRFKLLFAGRLLGWKGVALALGATARLVRGGFDVELAIAGDGPLRAHLAQQVRQRGLAERVQLLGSIPREQLLQLYGRADLFVFPSLHDSSGNVVLESLSRGLPVLCLDLGGPRHYVDESCGVVVSTQGRSREQLEVALAEAVAELLLQPERLQALSRGAAEQARRQTWAAAVERAYAAIGQALGWGRA